MSKLVDGKSLVFYDTEHATLQNSITYPFAERICTPDCYQDNIGPKQVRYPGYHELAYLHPDRFEADPSVLETVGVSESDSIVILRIVSWEAAHDVGEDGFDDIRDVVQQLESTGAKVLITSEAPLPRELETNRASVPPHKMHDLMSFADLFIGEGSTMAAESAVLGTLLSMFHQLNWDTQMN